MRREMRTLRLRLHGMRADVGHREAFMSAVDTELGGLWRCTIGFALLLFSQIPWPDSGPSGFSERSVIFSPLHVSRLPERMSSVWNSRDTSAHFVSDG
jgi:hypothetical protein